MCEQEVECEIDLNPSELGTKEFWDSFYRKEIDNFQDHQDVGEIWFGKATLQRIVKYLDSRNDVQHKDAIIDLGCGNGWTLIALAKLGYKRLVGVDYSENAIELARQVAQGENFLNIKYEVCDLISDCGIDKKLVGGDFLLALDKGTYDAISLSPVDSHIKKLKYKTNVASLLKSDGLLIISSCNWTEPELRDFFDDYFHYVEAICSPKTFQFGGKIGNDYSTLVFQRKS